MDAKIAETTQKLTKAEEMRNQTKLIMQPYANWEEYLTPAPLSIAILGELVFISSKEDFSINKNPPRDGYKHIRYPESFRACLMQVCNAGWWAFNEAHKNMGQIRLHTMAVPDFMKTAVQILFQGDDSVIKAHLPDQLENIRVIADDCLALSESTEKRFTDVISILGELMEACVNAERFYGKELEDIKRNLEENKLREQSAKERKERMEKALKNLEKEMSSAQETFNKALDSMPSGWDMIAMDFVGGLADSITNTFNGVVAAAVSEDKSKEHADSGADDVDQIKVYSSSAEILKYTERVLENVKENNIDWKGLYDQKNKATKTDFYKDQFKRISDEMKDVPKCKSKTDVLNLCNDGIEICSEIARHAPEGKCEEAKTEEKLIQKIKNLNDLAREFDTKSKNVTKSPPLSAKPPLMNKEESKKPRPSERAAENARFRIEQSRAQLTKTKEIYEKSVENMESTHKELTDILVTMRNCEVKEIDFNTKIQMLGKGLVAMGKVEEQWKKMVRFFQMVSNIVKISLTKTLHNFVKTSENTQSLPYNSKLFSKDLIYTQAFQASNIANLVHMISSTYTDISEKYLMDRVSSLGKLMTMEKNSPEFEQERQKLRNSCDDAQKEILRLVVKNKVEFEKKTDSRLQKIDSELLAILPKASPEEMKRIQGAVDSGFPGINVDDL